MNIIDIILILLLTLSAITGMKRGIVRELAMLIGIVITYFVAFSFKGQVGLLLCRILPFFDFDGLVSLNIIVYQLIAFMAIAVILFGIYRIILGFTGIVQKLVDISFILTLPSKILGFVVGLIEGYIVLFMILLVLQIPFKDNDLFINSKLSDSIVNNTFLLSSSLGQLDDCIVDIIDLTRDYNKSNSNQMNLKIIKLELKYNIISQEDLEKIIKTKKLDEIQGIQNM